MKKSVSDDIDKECSIFNVKTFWSAFPNTKLSMLSNLLSVGNVRSSFTTNASTHVLALVVKKLLTKV